MKQSTKRLLSTLMCVTALTSVLFVTGCGSDNKEAASGKPATTSESKEKVDNSVIENFNKLIVAKNNFNNDQLTWGKNYSEVYEAMKAGTYEKNFRGAKYEELQKSLEAVKKAGPTYKAVDDTLDGVLNALNELVPIVKDIKAYDDSKGYLTDGNAKGKELSAKYVAAVDKFNAAYNTLDAAVTATNKENAKKDIERFKSEGRKNAAAAMEALERWQDLVDEVSRTEQNPDKPKIEKEMNEILALANSIEGDGPGIETFKRNSNSLVGDIRLVLVDPNDRYQSRNLERMIQSYNRIVDGYNNMKLQEMDKK